MQILFENRACVVCIKPAGVESEEAPAVSAACPQAKAPSAAVPARMPARADGTPAGRAVSSRARPSTMPTLLRQAWGRADAPVFCVHRLDTATGGVMVYAKTKAAAAALSCQIAQGLLQKRYLCVCAGAPVPPCGEMHDFLFKDSRKNKVFPVKGARKGAKEARLEYEVLETRPLPVCPGAAAAQLSASSPQGARPQPGAPAKSTLPAAQSPCGDSAALCRVLLHTGRTHQIRVQFSSRKHPLFGDGKYGSRQKGPLGLWCESLTLTLPGETAPRTFTAPPPDAAPWRLFAAKEKDAL